MNKEITKPDWAMNQRERAAAERIAQGLAPKRRRRWPWLVLVLLLIAGGAGWFVQSGTLAEMQADREAAEAAVLAEAEARAARAAIVQLAPFEVTEVAPATLTESLRITGSLTPVRRAHLSSEVSARVETVMVRAGDAVAKGDVLVRFDPEALDSQLAQARANAEATRVQLEQARTDFERTQSLVERGLQPQNALDRARSTLDQLTATLAAQETLVANAERGRDRATVVAPFDGVISERSVDPGQFAATGTPLVTLVDLTALEVEATAPVAFAPVLTAGLAVDIRVEGFGERVFRGQVERLSPMAIEGSRMLPVYISLANTSGELRGGMFASGQIVLEAHEGAIGLPVGALRRDAEGAHVLVIETGTAERRAVEPGRTWDAGALVEIVSGLAPGEVVVSEPMPALRAGDKVELLGAGQ
ncbi:efflux RND transporter periplasmic adaptor subunit [Maritimibacter sp. HL-12]|jgi:membrane fusion protein, multidrug efflux system|uniref:efflux RND transporter periplasmic adaptor subunit n=1 Tax=Maritimibacter sp. HL-12 TaxID=1162418 RepID=UPI000A0F0862|nr:efflux RND transporter periplasmic adaptor subunit [Maritimibacter sp. HL-12]SMH36320.1 RND family efflux transporter, MFP subunit [Maritimibacter sp. HL-12]